MKEMNVASAYCVVCVSFWFLTSC